MILFWSLAVGAAPQRYWVPDGLDIFSSSTVYSIAQDTAGAIWFHTDRGLFRYNGHTAEYRGGMSVWTRMQGGENNSIYSSGQDALLKYSASTMQVDTLMTGGWSINSRVDDGGGRLLVGAGNNLYMYQDISPVDSVRLDEGVQITSLLQLAGGTVAVGTKSDGVLLLGRDQARKASLPCESRVSALFEDSSGRLWAGLLKGGAMILDKATLKVLGSYPSCDGKQLLDVRSFAESKDGCIYLGTAAGLFKVSKGGAISEETPAGHPGEPICSIFTDKDGNLWTGTYYHGVYFTDFGAIPLNNINKDSRITLIKGMAEDRNGLVWLLTDGSGMFRYDPSSGTSTLIPGTTGIKYQSAGYDPVTDKIWAGEFRGRVLSYDILSCKEQIYTTTNSETRDGDGSVCAFVRDGDDLLLGSTTGLYRFNPLTETTISRKIHDSVIYAMEKGKDGRIYFAGVGLYSYDEADGVRRISLDDQDAWMHTTPCYDIEHDDAGRLWMAYPEEGIVCLDSGKVTRYSSANIGLSDNYTSNITICGNGDIVVVSNSGISLISPPGGECFNYNKSNGLDFGATIGSKSIVLSDGTILLGGNDGMQSIPKDFPPIRKERPSVVPDKFFVNGERIDTLTTLPFLKKVLLKHDQNNFSIETATFNYTCAEYTLYQYRLTGFDKVWKEFSPQIPVSFMNIKPGHYTFELRASHRGGEQESAYASLPIRIYPAWYATLAAKILFLTFAVLVILIILTSVNSRMILAEKLRLKERENEEKTRFFVNLSYQLRTPVNLIIGQLERFFMDFGSRTAGIEDIENIYGKAKEMREMISDYVDTQNEEKKSGAGQADDGDGTLAGAYENAKFLNAAIGVVERNLFTNDLNVTLLCSEMNLGKTTLTARIKEASGLTPREFIEDIRLKHAAEMISDGVYRISEIADKLSFSSPKYFSRRFKLKYGVNPRDYIPK